MNAYTISIAIIAIASTAAFIREWIKHIDTAEEGRKWMSMHQECRTQLTKWEKQMSNDRDETFRNTMRYREMVHERDNTIQDILDDLRAARRLNKEKQKVIDGYVLSDITAIKFTARIPDVGWKRTEFKLGLGPCGKEVKCLHWEELDDRYKLTQTCTDGERKEFTYDKEDVAGRIEMSYKVSNTTH